jgi:ATP-binding cassette subfamily B protein
MSEDVEEIEVFLAHHIPDIASAIVFPLIVFIFLFLVNWILAIATLIPVPLGIYIMTVRFGNREEYVEWHKASEEINKTVVEYVRGIPVVKVFNATDDSFSLLKNRVYKFRDGQREMAKAYAKVYPAFLSILSSSVLFLVPVAIILLAISDSPASLVPTIILFLIIGSGLFFPLYKLMFMSNYIRKITTGIERMDVIMKQPDITEPKIEQLPQDNSIEFADVSFKYKDATILDHVSFKIEPGTITALVGPSGAGKTTIGYLCTRFWDVNDGSIKVGGVDIRDMRLDTLMKKISFLFQDVYLFYDTIEENIRMGNDKVSKDEIMNAAKLAQCHDFIMELPDGYDTLIGEGGTYLSGGEAQRIGIARVIIKNAPIIVLDEATAFADPEGEGKILEGFSHLIDGKTVVIIAHRLSTIVDADKIIVLEGGKVVEIGTHAELNEKRGLYNKMWDIYSKSREWRLAQS